MHASDGNTPDDDTTASTPLLRRLIRPWEYRHADVIANVRFAIGGFDLGVGLVLLSLGRQSGTDQERRKCYKWSAWFLVNSALQFLGGFLDTAAARSAPPRT